MFYISENNNDWTAVSATTLADARRAAERAQEFQGTDIFVGVESDYDDGITVVAKKLHLDALDMNATGVWQGTE